MPQSKFRRLSLSQLCMNNVVSSMDKWCAKHNAEWASHRELDSMFVFRHFVRLPSHCLEYMINRLICKYQLKKEMFYLLLTPHLRVLDCQMISCAELTSEEIYRTLRLASITCPQLTKLVMPVAEFYPELYRPETNLFALVAPFENLRDLDLNSTDIDSSCFEILGTSSCKVKLRVLCIDNCPNVDDTAVEKLCIAQGSLQELSCSETKITVAGIIFALQHLPELKQIEHNVIEFDTFKFFQLDHEQGKKCRLTKLPMPTDIVYFSDLQVHVTPLTSGNIALIGSVFLSLEHLEIHECGFASGVSDAEFIGFGQLKKLKTIFFGSLRKILAGSITFHGGVVPVIKILGRQLEVLSMHDVPIQQAAQIGLLTQCCPNLSELLLRISYDDSTDDGLVNPPLATRMFFSPLQNLKSLIMYIENPSDQMLSIPPQMLLSLLSSPNLKKITIWDCVTLSDEIVEQADAIHGFQYLKELFFNNCPSISHKAIDLFKKESMLKDLHLANCDGVDPNICEDWEIMIKQRKWKLFMNYRIDVDQL